MLLIVLCFFSLSLTGRAVEQVEGVWEVLAGCRLVSSPINDGDSFLVKYGDETFTFRLYYVDALETNVSYIDRVREQARYSPSLKKQSPMRAISRKTSPGNSCAVSSL